MRDITKEEMLKQLREALTKSQDAFDQCDYGRATGFAQGALGNCIQWLEKQKVQPLYRKRAQKNNPTVPG